MRCDLGQGSGGKPLLIEDDTARRVIQAALSRGVNYADIFAEHREGYNLRLEEAKIEENTTGSEIGAGIRLIMGESVAYAYTNDLSEDSLLETARVAASAVRGGEKAPINLEQKWNMLPVLGEHPIEINLEDFAREDKIALLQKADEAARSAGHEVVQVIAALGDSRQQIFLANSLDEIVLGH